jgi:Icc-related predicted phosphoesterase
MKFILGSDFHLEEEKSHNIPCSILPEPDTDFIVLAGDVGEGFSHIDWLKEASDKYCKGKKTEIIYLPGNHCFYNSYVGKKEILIKERLENYHVHVINEGYLEVGDYVFICATLWTDFSLFPDRVKEAKMDYQATMIDRKKVKGRGRKKLFENNMQKLSIENIRFIRQTLERFKNKKCIVVTHHAPSIKSIPDELQDDIDAVCYANNLEELILTNPQIKVWCHGHIHHSSDYYIGSTRIICNPFKGMWYEDEWANQNWNPSLHIKLD